MLIKYLKDDVDFLVVLFLGELCLRVFVLVWPNSSYERFQNIFHEIFLTSSAEKSWNERVVGVFKHFLKDFSNWRFFRMMKKICISHFSSPFKICYFFINMVNISHTDIYFRFLSFDAYWMRNVKLEGKYEILSLIVWFYWYLRWIFYEKNVFCKNAQKCPTW